MFSGSLKFILLAVYISVNHGFQYLELNHDLGPDTPAFPYENTSHFDIQFIEKGYKRGYWMAQNNYMFADLIGTSVTAPSRFYQNGTTVDKIPFQNLFAEAVVINVKDKVVSNENYEITKQDVDNWMDIHKNLPPKSVVIFYTGWDEGRWPEQTKYYGTNVNLQSMKYPAVKLEAIEALLKYEKAQGVRIVGFGIDTPSLESGPAVSRGLPVLHYIAEADRYVINNLRNVKRLPAIKGMLMTMPLKAREGTAAPARVVGRLPDRTYF